LLPSGLGVDSTWGRGNSPLLPTCCGVYGGTAGFNPDAVDMFMGDTELVFVDGSDSCTDQQIAISYDSTDWWTGIPTIATMTTGKVKALSAGTTTGYAKGNVWEGYGTNCAWGQATAPVPITAGPLIQWNGNDITGTTQSAVVGQKIALSSAYSLPSGVTVQSRTWTVVGTTVGGFNTGTNGGPVATTFTQDTATFYWVTVGNSLSVTFTLNLGDGTHPTATTTFNVVGPSAPSVAAPTGQVIVTTSSPLKLRFGASNANPGIKFTASATPPPGYSNTFVWVQILNNYSISLQGNPNHLCSWTGVLARHNLSVSSFNIDNNSG
jgi:hypothetical protein